ncbi:alpha/beta hydrolase domain-containing protein [Parafrankia elaeagni]|uniref:alpha/beta hydrolase domain-containing protein n=1 Tax=Parafrankia elaeagni TaxID=222534 RepID=UPI0004774862|nr:alpha/beta hydrolase domain-containing protein [Parafrankia elaeagni]
MSYLRLLGRRFTALLGATACAIPMLAVCASSAHAAPRAGAVASPAITVPAAGSHGFPFQAEEPALLAAKGYVEREFLFGGTATAYNRNGAFGSDGRWQVTPGTQAPYQSRMLVRYPADPAKFNGTVLVEWFNVSGGIDAQVDWTTMREEILRSGYAYVGVSAQQLGINAAGEYPGLKAWDQARYGTLNHPGDQYSYDIFSQAAQALRTPNGPNPLGTLKFRKLLGVGESQSAMRLTTYVNAVAPVARVYDGYLIHSNMAVPTPLSADPSERMPNPTLIRTDLRVPTFVVLTETDMTLHVSARQPDSATVHTWELAGTSHADQWLLTTGQPVYERMFGRPVPPRDCGANTAPINDGPAHYSLNAALSAMNRWIRGGPAPATGALLAMEGSTPVRDPATGLARGGVRLPDVTVPTRTLSGQRHAEGLAALFCGLFGATDPWNGDTDPWDRHDAGDPSNPTAPQTAEPVLSQLYPTHADYVNKVRAAAWTSVLRGFLTPADARTIVTAASNSTIGG